jgi:diadenylate cyclase
MRHRAGLGLSEETDAIVLIVSEETGTISIALNGRLTRNLSKEELATILKGLLKKKGK